MTDQQLYLSIRQGFENAGYSVQDYLTKKELFTVLNSNAGSNGFDLQVGKQLWHQMPKEKNKKVTIDSFIGVFIQADTLLKEKILIKDGEIAQLYKERHLYEELLLKEQIIEQLNPNGIMPNSMVTIKFLSAGNIMPEVFEGDDYNCYAKVFRDRELVGGVKDMKGVDKVLFMQSPEKDGKDYIEFNPIFNPPQDMDKEDWEPPKFCTCFMVENPITKINIELYNQTFGFKVGVITIPLTSLKSQFKLRRSFLCSNGDQNKYQTYVGKLDLELQWVFSKVQFFEDLLEKYDTQIRETQEDKRDWQQDKRALFAPFPGAEKATAKEMIMKNSIKIPENKDVYLDYTPPVHIGSIKYNTNYQVCSNILAAILFTISLFICIEKAQFLDLTVCCMYFYNYVTRSFTRMMLNSYCIGLGLSSLMDFMWFVLEGSHEWSKKELTKYDKKDKYYKREILILVTCIFFLKMFMVVSFQRFKSKLKKTDKVLFL